jgi:hypothetical protein
LTGNASQPSLASGGGVLQLAWADDTQQSRVGSTVAIYARKWSGVSFKPDFSGDVTFNGISFTGGALRSLDVAVNGNGQPFVAWNDQASGSAQIYDRGNTYGPTGVTYDVSLSNIQGLDNTNSIPRRHQFGFALPGFTIPAGSDDAGASGPPRLVHHRPHQSPEQHHASGREHYQFHQHQRRHHLQGVNITGPLTSPADRFTPAEHRRAITLSGRPCQLADNTISGTTGITLTGSRQSRHRAQHHQRICRPNSPAPATNVMVRDNTITPHRVSIGAPPAARCRQQLHRHHHRHHYRRLHRLHRHQRHRGDHRWNYAAAASLSGNLIHNNTTGVVATVAGIVNGLGFATPWRAKRDLLKHHWRQPHRQMQTSTSTTTPPPSPAPESSAAAIWPSPT